MAKFKIGDAWFRTKGAAKRDIKGLLKCYSNVPGNVAEVGASLLMDLLKMHPEAEQKIGVGVASFNVRKNPPYNTPGFWITRIDGSETDFSYLACFNAPTVEQDAKAAFRAEVDAQVFEFRRDTFGSGREVRCSVTGEVLEFAGSHVDHIVPFREILSKFITVDGLDLSTTEVEPTSDGETLNRLVDRDMAKRWFDYHMEHATLRMVTAFANLSLLRRTNQNQTP